MAALREEAHMKPIVSGVAGILLSAAMPLAFAQDMNTPLLRTIAPVSATAPLHFNDLTEVYRYIVQSRGLGSPDDEAVVRALIAGSTVTQVQDGAGHALTVIKADLVRDGKSGLASAEGNLPYYVLHQSAGDVTLLGTMFGDSYTSSVANGRVQFSMRLRLPAGKVRDMRFEVRDEALVNLTPIGSQRTPFIADV
jgi:hypothetical protein